MATKKVSKKASEKMGAAKVVKKATSSKAPAPKKEAAKKTPTKVSAPKKTSTKKTPTKASAPKKTSTKTGAVKKASAKVSSSHEKGEAPLGKKTKPSAASAAGTAVSSGVDVGALAPSFELVDQSGTVISSEALKGAHYVLYFYPKDNTPGCTQEACDFRDHHASFTKKKVKVFGVSGDSEKSHAGFAAKYSLPFSLLVDEGNALAAKYGAYGPKKLYGREFLGIIRSTFVVGKDGRIAAAYRGVKVPGHVEKLLEVIA